MEAATDEHNPAYKQKDGTHYMYHKDGWKIGPTVGGDDFTIHGGEDAAVSPDHVTSTWREKDPDGQFVDKSSLEVKHSGWCQHCSCFII